MNVKKKQILNERQQKFCRLCAEGKTIDEAERLVGFTKGYGRKLMKKAYIQEAIAPAGEVDESRMEQEPAAQKTEILGFLTDVLRDKEAADIKTRMKAAELLGKRESLFERMPQQEESRIVIVDDLP